MTRNASQSLLKQWLRLNRLIPLLTILGAGIALILSLLGSIQLTVPEGIVIALLGLLVIDALTERLTVLETIDARLRNLSGGQSLKGREAIPPIDQRLDRAREVCIAVVSGHSLFSGHLALFERLLRDGCTIRVLLLDPNGASVTAWDQTEQVPYGQTRHQ